MDASSWVVLKFGGTSVSSRERWETIRDIVQDHIENGRRPFVVCSALSGVSDELESLLQGVIEGSHEAILADIRQRHLDLAVQLGVQPESTLLPHFEQLSRLVMGASLIQEVSPRLHAKVMAYGELLSTSLGAAFLNCCGLNVDWIDAREHLVSDSRKLTRALQRYLSAHCQFTPDDVMQKDMASRSANCILTQGFIASDPNGDTVLLGRGGSDTSAAYFAAKLQAERCEIWTDVAGIFSANPRMVPEPFLLKRLDYDEAQEITSSGAQVLHPRCLDPVKQYHIPLHIRCTLNPKLESTVIGDFDSSDEARVKVIAAKSGVTLISMETMGMWQEVGFLARVFDKFSEHRLSVDLVSTSQSNVTASLDQVANALDPASIEALLEDLQEVCAARVIGPCAAISLVGRNIRSIMHELGPALKVFGEHKIHLVSQAANDLNLTFVVGEDQAQRLVRELHALLVQKKLEAPKENQTEEREMEDDEVSGAHVWWRKRADELLDMARDESPLFVYDEETLDEAAESLLAMSNVERIFYAIKANAHPDILSRFYHAGIGFECVSPGELDHIVRLFPDLKGQSERMLFTPNFASGEEYRHGFELGASVTLDNLYPLEAWPNLFKGREIFVRIDPGKGRGHHKHVKTAGEHSKFGILPTQIPRLLDAVKKADARIVGLHAHTGSGILTYDAWIDTARFFTSLLEQLPDVRHMDLGGGLGIPERPGQPVLDTVAINESLRPIRLAYPEVAIWLEPGRYLVARAGVLLAKVTQVKEKRETAFVGIDVGMNTLIRPALYGAYHRIVNLSRLDDTRRETVNVVGPICETGDTLGYNRALAPSQEGDILLIATAGAYGRVMSSSYNMRPPAAEKMLARR